MSRAPLRAIFVAILVAVPSSITAQDTDLATVVAGLNYRSVGPANMGGRIAELAVVEAKPQVFYIGVATGGVWKTENHGTSWTPLFDDQPTSSIGAITVHQPNPNLIWVGTGEPQNRQSSPWGNGVYKSTDAGRTWSHMGLTDTHHIARIIVHPRNPDIVYVAAVGHLWGPNEERGVFRTDDGGMSWERVLYVDQHTGAIDLAMDPGDPSTLFAAMYQRQRTGWGFNGGGPGSGLYRTLDGGATWTELTNGLPEGDKGRIGVDVFRQDGNVVYALVEADARAPGSGFGGGGGGDRQGGTFRSMDRGDTWEKMSNTNPRPMYYSQIRIDPTNASRVYVLGTQLMVSDDGGKTFRSDGARQIHVDHHDLWINPEDPDHLIIASDGGVAASWDGTKHWRMFDNIPIGQFYQIGYDMRDPYYVCGGLQDNDSWCGPQNTRSFHGIRNQDWYEVVYGDGFFTLVDPTDSNIVFSESQGGNLNRYDLATGEKTSLRPIPGPRADGDTSKTYRFNWDAPLLISPHDPATIYIGANYLMRSRDRGVTWEEVGGVDLTKQIDRAELEIMGVAGSERQMSVNDGISNYGTLTAVAESPFTPQVIYVGTDDGNVQVSRDAGANWTNVADRIDGLPARTYVSRIVPSAHVEGRVYATFDGHRNDDFAAYVFVSENYGRDWDRITTGLPDGWSVNVVVEHPRTENLLFVGNEVGVYFSANRGREWHRIKNNLPTVPVDDLALHPRENDLIVGTHGRSIWILADVTPLEHLASGLLADAGRVFPIPSSTMWAERGDWPFYGATFSAPNPPRGARIRYYLRDAATDGEVVTEDGGNNQLNGNAGFDDSAGAAVRASSAVSTDTSFTLVVTDAAGTHIRKLKAPGTAGIHEVIWDWRFDPPFERQPSPGGGGGGFGGGAPQGPVALPGTYTVSMTVGGQEFHSTVDLVADPRRVMSAADRTVRQDALMTLYRFAKPLNEVNQALRRLDGQVREAKELAEEGEAPEGLVTALDSLADELGAARREYTSINRNARISNAMQASSTRPTEDQLWQVRDVAERTPALVETVNAFITVRIPAIHEMLNEAGLRESPGKPIVIPANRSR